jgi:glutamine cyclotransferase
VKQAMGGGSTWIQVGLAVALLVGCQPRTAASAGAARSEGSAAVATVQELRVQVLRRLPHDPKAFTQGLLWHAGKLYESTGLYGESSLRRLNPVSGVIEKEIDLPPQLFGEGLARIDNQLIQLTWKEGLARRYRLADFELAGQWRYDGEGWGLCYDGHALVMSDGSATLTWRNPESFVVERRAEVRMSGSPVTRLNELECAEGWIYANQLNSDWIYRIDPSNGRVVARINAGHLDPADEAQPERVLNGIAYDEASHHFYLTGKKWSILLEVIFVGR